MCKHNGEGKENKRTVRLKKEPPSKGCGLNVINILDADGVAFICVVKYRTWAILNQGGDGQLAPNKWNSLPIIQPLHYFGTSQMIQCNFKRKVQMSK